MFLQSTTNLLASKQEFNKKFWSEFDENEKISIVVGYGSEASVKQLEKKVGSKCVTLYIGLLLTEKSIDIGYLNALNRLDAKLQKTSGGGVFLTTQPVHAKVYYFHSSKLVITGSSNLNAICGASSIEIDTVFNGGPEVVSFFSIIKSMGEPITKCLGALNVVTNDFIAHRFVASGQVRTMSTSQLAKLPAQNLRAITIPLKASSTKKSNINACFGGGRERPWYEVEFGIGSKLKGSGLPVGLDFLVITPEHYCFSCSCQSTSNWLRSKGDLQILGQWMKNTIMSKCSYKFNDLLMDAHLKEAGLSELVLTPSKGGKYWYISLQ